MNFSYLLMTAGKAEPRRDGGRGPGGGGSRIVSILGVIMSANTREATEAKPAREPPHGAS